jgi:hypothetical protein
MTEIEKYKDREIVIEGQKWRLKEKDKVGKSERNADIEE